MTDTSGTSDAARRSRLLGVKLRALVRDHLADDDVPEPMEFAPGAALLHGGEAWVLVDERPAARLGAAIAWALRSGATALHVIAESGTGVLARRAAAFDLPISVWHADERDLLPSPPEPFAPAIEVPDEHERFRSLIEEGGAEPLVEHGVLVGEVRGLEVCRVVDDPATGATRLEVGVGAHDREAFQMLHGDVPAAESLARVSAAVARHRRTGAPQHPLNRIAAERFVRWRVVADPALVGARELRPVEPPVPRPNLKDPMPCVAHGVGEDDRRVIVVCSTGVDLDLLPYAADARLAAEAAMPGAGGRSRLVVALPSRDRVRVTDELAGRLRHSVELVSLD